jgi:glycosyltransferase involved in cell wall biosynthesis
MAIAARWCAEHGVDFKPGDYTNPTEPNWPHVESFGAARQQAVNLATGDWCMWLDADDVLEGDAKEFRALVAKTESDWISLVYDVRNMQRAFPRERLWRRGKARWGRPVHEQLSPTEPSCRIMFYVGPNHPRVVHAPIDTRARSRDRNLRILDKSILEGTPSYFYRGWDLLLDGKPDKAAADFQRCLAVDDDPAAAPCLILAPRANRREGGWH